MNHIKAFLMTLAFTFGLPSHGDVSQEGANKTLVRSVFKALETGDLAVLNSAFDPNGISIIGSIERPRGGPFDSFDKAAPFPAALEERRVDIEALFAEDDKVAVQSKLCGVHVKPLVGFEATRKLLCARYTNLYTIKNNKIIINVVGFDPELRKALKKNSDATKK